MQVKWTSYQLFIQLEDGARQWQMEYDLDCADNVDALDADAVLTE